MNEQTDERGVRAALTEAELDEIKTCLVAYNRSVNAMKKAHGRFAAALRPRMVVYHRTPGESRAEGVPQVVWTYETDGHGKLITGVAVLAECESPAESMSEE